MRNRAIIAIVWVIMASCIRKEAETPAPAITRRIPHTTPEPAKELPLGFLTDLVPRVTLRRNRSLSWEDGKASLALFAYDAVRTHLGAGAKITLKNGSELQLEQDTLIILSPSIVNGLETSDRASISAGKLRGVTKRELWLMTSAALLRMRPKGKETTAQAEVLIPAGKKIRVTLKNGEASLLQRKINKRTQKKEVVTLKPNKPLELDVPTTKEEQKWEEADFQTLSQAPAIEQKVV